MAQVLLTAIYGVAALTMGVSPARADLVAVRAAKRPLTAETAAWWTFDNHLRDEAHGLQLKNVPNKNKKTEAHYVLIQFGGKVPVLGFAGHQNYRSYYRWGIPQLTKCLLADELDAPAAFTIEAYIWARRGYNWRNRPRQILLRKYRLGPGRIRQRQWLIELRQPPKDAPQAPRADLWASVTFLMPDGRRVVREVTAKEGIRLAAWQRFAVVYDARTLSLVVGGKPVASVPGPGPGARLLPSGGKSRLLISSEDKLPDGRRTPAGSPHLSAVYPGWIDELRFTAAALSGDQLLPPVQTVSRDPLPDPPRRKEYTSIVRRHLDLLLKHGTDVYGPARSPLLASTLDPKTLRMVKVKPAILEGMRHPGGPGDSPLYGCNLDMMRDTLMAMRALSAITGDARYAAHAERALRFWFKHCPYPSGVWPTGEHGVYNFYTEQAQPDYWHEPVAHLDWARYYRMAPEAVTKEIDLAHKTHVFKYAYKGKDLWFHGRHGSTKGEARDWRWRVGFARQSGLFARAWAFMYAKTKDRKYLQWARDQVELIWQLRDPKTGFSAGQVYPPPGTKITGTLGTKPCPGDQVVSAALGFLEAADWIDDPAEKKFFVERAEALAMANFNSFYKWDGKKFNRPLRYASWFFLKYWERVGRPAHLLVGLKQIADEVFAKWRPAKNTPARTYGRRIMFLVQLYNETGEERYMKLARRLGDIAAANLVAENGLVVGSGYYRIYDRMYYVPYLIQAFLVLDHPKHPATQPLFRVVR